MSAVWVMVGGGWVVVGGGWVVVGGVWVKAYYLKVMARKPTTTMSNAYSVALSRGNAVARLAAVIT
jgi:hypothetical protein